MSEIAVLVSSLTKVSEVGARFVFTDRHAYLQTAQDRFSSDLKDLDRIDWTRLQSRDFKRNLDDPERFERYQAEALVYRHLPVGGLIMLGCRSSEPKAALEAEVERRGLLFEVAQKPEWYP